MGDIGSSVTSIFTGKKGTNATQADPNAPSNPLVAMLQSGQLSANGAGANNLLAQYANGGMSLQDLISQSRANGGTAFTDRIATDPLTGTKMASEQVMSNPLYSGMWGSGGMQDQMLNEQNRLATSGYNLQPEDYDALGQASDNIARQYGNQEQSLSQMLAQRGMGAGPNGASGVAYSGLQGNKLEALAQNQKQIAMDRMNTNFQRLNAVRGQIMQNNQLAQGALQGQYGRNVQGAEDNFNKAASTAGLGMQDQGLQQNINNANFDQQQKTGFGSIFANTAKQETMNPANFTAGFSSSLGSSLGSLFGGGMGGKGGGGLGQLNQVQNNTDSTPGGAYISRNAGYSTIG